MSTEEHTLKSNVKIQRQPVSGHLDGSPDEAEILGYIMFSTTGEMLIPRDWLIEQFEELGLPDSLMPPAKWPSSAYKLAMTHLIDKNWEEKWISGQRVTFHMEEGDGNVRHVYANVHYTEEQTGEPGGTLDTVNLGVFDYDVDAQSVKFRTKVEENREALHTRWKQLVGRSQGLFKKMLKSNTGQDMRTVLLDLVNDETTAMSLRTGGAVYFFPAGYEKFLDPLSTLWDRLNKFKTDGKACRLQTVLVLDNEDYRQMIEERAEEVMADAVDRLVEAAFESLEEDEEETAEVLAEGILGDLGAVSNMADDYSSILETKLSVKRHLERWLRESKGEKQEIVQRVLDKHEGKGLPEVDL